MSNFRVDLRQEVGSHDSYLKPGMAWSAVIDAPWAYKKKYVLPTPAQAQAVAQFIEWVTSSAAGLAITRRWIGLADGALAMGQLESAAKLKPGLYAHHYFGHADGAWLVIYAWLRLEAGLAPDVAFNEAVRRATGVRRRVDPFRKSLQAFLQNAGEADVAAMLASADA